MNLSGPTMSWVNEMRSGDHWRSPFLEARRTSRQESAALAAHRRLGIKHATGSPSMQSGNFSFKSVKWFAIELPITYEGAEGRLLQGNGRTLAMSSGAVQFACDRNLTVGQVVQLSIQWPARLSDGTSLSLWATGTIRRSANCEVEVAIRRHEFRTRRASGARPSIMLVAPRAC